MTPIEGRGAVGRRATDARRRITTAWGAAGPTGRAWLASGIVAGALLVGAFLFGAWHVVFGYVVKGNPRAGLFGLVLAAVTGALLAAGLAAARRWLPRG